MKMTTTAMIINILFNVGTSIATRGKTEIIEIGESDWMAENTAGVGDTTQWSLCKKYTWVAGNELYIAPVELKICGDYHQPNLVEIFNYSKVRQEYVLQRNGAPERKWFWGGIAPKSSHKVQLPSEVYVYYKI
jgi:hypothetical protein